MSDAVNTPSGEQQNFLDMSDEDIMKMPTPNFEAVTVATPAVEQVAGEGESEGGGAAASTEAADDAAGAKTEGTGKDAVDEPGVSQGEEKAAATVTDPAGEPDKAPAVVAEKPVAEVAETVVKVDYEQEYKRLLAPFRANGRDVQVESVDDAISLMQMGANYNKKMAALKPSLKLMKMLENNGLLSEEKIGYLIDLEKKVPGAVSRLVSESGIDPMEIDADKAKAYKQNTYAVDDRELVLDTVLGELQDSPTYTRTLDVVGNKWDVASKQVVAQSPQLLKVINDHVASGIYDLISTEMERERLFGRLSGLSDIEAYRHVGDAIQARGGFNHLGKAQETKKTEPVVAEVVQPKPKVVEDDTLKDKRRAASSTKPAIPTVVPKDFNPLGLSDEEFSKLATPKFS